MIDTVKDRRVRVARVAGQERTDDAGDVWGSPHVILKSRRLSLRRHLPHPPVGVQQSAPRPHTSTGERLRASARFTSKEIQLLHVPHTNRRITSGREASHDGV